jgi:hypothetical protein
MMNVVFLRTSAECRELLQIKYLHNIERSNRKEFFQNFSRIAGIFPDKNFILNEYEIL